MMKAKREKIIEVLTEGHLEFGEGYPYDWQVLEDGTLVIASIDHDDSSCLEVYPKLYVELWLEAMQDMIDDPDCFEEREERDWHFFVHESRPEQP